MNLALALAKSLERSTVPALIFGAQRFSGPGLLARAEGLRRRLEQLGLARLDRVAWLLPNHPALLLAHLATLSMGAIGVPLNPLYSPGELRSLLRASTPCILVCLPLTLPLAQAALKHWEADRRPTLLCLQEPELEPGLRQALLSQICRSAEVGQLPVRPGEPGQRPDEGPDERHGRPLELDVALNPALEAENAPLESCELEPSHPALILFTSGTTGRPKGATLSHHSLLHNASFIAREWLGGIPGEGLPPWRPGHARPGEPHVGLAALPLCHNFGLNVTLDALILHGGTLVLRPRFSAVEVLRAIQSERVSFVPLVPTMTQALLNNPELDRVDSSSLSLLVSGGAALPGAMRERVLARWPDLALRDTYGLSEASLVACTCPGSYGQPGTVGRAIAETQLEVVDEHGQPCAPETVGEVRVRGPGLMLGYWGQNAEDGPLRAGWLYTGDLGRFSDEGDLTIVDRQRDVIVHGGYKIFPLEVEEALYAHPWVQEAVVFGVPDARMGERVVAFVSPREGVQLEPAALLSHCRHHLAEFKLPSRIEVRTSLPRNATGKLLRRLLRDEVA